MSTNHDERLVDTFYDTFRKVNISHSNFIKSVLVASWLNGWEERRENHEDWNYIL